MEYVYSNNQGTVWNRDGSMVDMKVNDIWFAADPFVQRHLNLFSATPLQVHSTEGREAPAPTPVGVAPVAPGPELVKPRGRRA